MENILKKLNDKFRKESPLTTCRGKVLEYLGMKTDSQQQGKVKFMKSNKPTSSYLFNTDPGCNKLSEERGQLFHHLEVKLLSLSKHTRQVIQMAVAFLCTRVKDPDNDNYKKLTKFMHT